MTESSIITSMKIIINAKQFDKPAKLSFIYKNGIFLSFGLSFHRKVSSLYFSLHESKRYLNAESKGRVAILEDIDCIEVVLGNILEALRAGDGGILSAVVGSVLTGALAAGGEVGQPWVLHVCQQVEPVVSPVRGLSLEGEDCAPADGVVIEFGDGAVGGGGQVGRLDLDALQGTEEGDQ